MATKDVQYVSNATTSGLYLPNSDANCGVVTAVKPADTTWGSKDNEDPLTVVGRDVSAQDEEDFEVRKKAIDRTDPTGTLLDVAEADWIVPEDPPE